MAVILTALVEGESEPRTVTLPSPKLGAVVSADPQTKIQRLAAGGGYRTFKLGPTRWQIKRTFEGLTEAQIKAFWIFWEAIGGPATQVTYQSRVPVAGEPPLITTPYCLMIGTPEETKVSYNQWDLSVTFEHDMHPDSETNRDVVV